MRFPKPSCRRLMGALFAVALVPACRHAECVSGAELRDAMSGLRREIATVRSEGDRLFREGVARGARESLAAGSGRAGGADIDDLVRSYAERATLDPVGPARGRAPAAGKVVPEPDAARQREDQASKDSAVTLGAAGGREVLLEALRSCREAMNNCAWNLANADTYGYKRARVVCGDGRVVEVRRDFNQGSLEVTNQPLDWAVEGDGLFRLVRDRTYVYTRVGCFYRNRDGQIVNAMGLPLYPPIAIPDNIADVSVSIDGHILGRDLGDPANVYELGQVELVRFVQPAGLRAIGDNLFEASEESAGVPVEGLPGDAGLGILRDRVLEQSNVDILQEVIELRVLRRWHDNLMSALDTMYPPPEQGK